jgi:hypothetical protein
MQLKILSYILVFAAGIGACLYFDDNVHEIKEEIVYKDRIRTVVKEVVTKSPDGTTVTQRTTDKVEKKDKQVNKVESKPIKPNWMVGVKYDLFRPVPVWTAEVQRRVIGNVYAGAYGRTDGVVGVSLSVTF